MNGLHDMGGMDGFGPLDIEENEPVFHAPWEARTRALSQVVRQCKFYWIDEGRHVIERINPVYYAASNYYQRWLLRTETLLIEKGILTEEELEKKMTELAPGGEHKDKLHPYRHVRPLLPSDSRDLIFEPTSGTTDPNAEVEIKFPPGTVVKGKLSSPLGHTRIPRYVRGKKGVVDSIHGLYYLPDVLVHKGEFLYQTVYRVRYNAQDLWGKDANPNDKLYIELWEDYLELGE